MFDLCTGGDLNSLIKRTPKNYLEEDTAKVLIRQLVSAVAHIHSRGICHRDIKLQNILLENLDSQNAQIKLIDFGFAIRFVGVTPMKTRCGTPYSTAPEVFRECYDERCDVWSVGVVCYYLLCGHRPFDAVVLPGDLEEAGKAAMVTNIMMGRYHFNHQAFKDVSVEGVTFIQKLLAPNYRHRCSAKDTLSLSWLSKYHTKTKFDVDSLNNKDTPLSIAVSNLKGKRKSSVLGNTGMVAVAFHHSRDDGNELRALFQSFDTENSGVLSKTAFRNAMKSVSPDLSSDEIDQLFTAIDVDDDKQISFTEFMAATMDPRKVDTDELSKAFQLLDSDNKGYLTVDDFYRVLSTSAVKSENSIHLSTKLSVKVNNKTINFDDSVMRGKGVSLEDISKSGIVYDEPDAGTEREKAILMKKIAQMITSADANNDGVLSYSEFLVGIVGLDDSDYDEHGHTGNIDTSHVLSLLSEQRDVFEYNSLAKSSEKMKLKNLLHVRGADPTITQKLSDAPVEILCQDQSRESKFSSKMENGSNVDCDDGVSMEARPREQFSDTSLPSIATPEGTAALDTEKRFDMLDLCSTVEVGSLGSLICFKGSVDPDSNTNSPLVPKVKGPPTWAVDKK